MTADTAENGGAAQSRLIAGPIPEVAVAVGATMIIFAGGLVQEVGWNAGALFVSGLALGGLGLVAQSYREKIQEVDRE